MTHESAVTWFDPGYYAFDLWDGYITNRVVITGRVNVMAVSGSVFTLLYNVRDTAGNNATERQRVVTMRDTIPPVITLIGNATYYQQALFAYVDPGATAYDTLNGNLTTQISVYNTVHTSNPAGATFRVRYNVQDVAGNAAIEVYRTVIIFDRFPPTIYLQGSTNMTWQRGVPWVDPGFIANDTLGILFFCFLPLNYFADGSLNARVAIIGEVNVFAPAGTVFTLNYTVNIYKLS